ncbi:MAG: hypothetical protein Kow00117_19690 [Phototrophicales bacterium]
MSDSYDLLCMGRSTLDLFGNTVGADFTAQRMFSAYLGGSPMNICVGAHRLGLKTVMLTGVSDDEIGRYIRQAIREEGITDDYVITKPGTLTNIVIGALQPPGGGQFAVYHAANADLQLNFEDILNAPIPQSKVFLFTGMCLLAEPSRSATYFAAERAQAHERNVVMDLDYRPAMWDSVRTYGVYTRAVLPHVDIVIGTEDEVLAATGTDDLTAAVITLLSVVKRAVLVKRGAEGCEVYTVQGAAHAIPPFPAEEVNIMGAGDGFAAGFLYGYLRGWTLVKSARFANACGAIQVSTHGTGSEMPALSVVLDFIDEHGGF